ncbi:MULTISPECIES: NAD(+) diphosphatase [Micromonospora]|uniref:NAD(+) diphosphatase n=1 Tax=Micromonospora solifontis TaxID=2487138 RepID=A0ABX9WP96_9ACTN|nr:MULTISPECIES: NAD(+) diphosphatase [Micromonospora]NES14308.1 NAD(+) diphosphatase [Micromonospora sp. PPF5-17B]NES35084.1 NAD(+) diphosphatase [Micromonospora solifontis]NES57735.1 NAD(+) diphosphatase [Micromonospora sp. PPF5-6]RNM01354.1 NAD(+) diphosphatase [Micromonospora solifontis]
MTTGLTGDTSGGTGPGRGAADGRSGFVPGADRSRPPAPGDLALPVAGRKLLTGPEGGLPRIADLPADLDWVPVGTLDGTPAWAAEVADPGTLAGHWRGWRSLATELPAPQADLAGRALAVLTWRRTHRWCGACRTELADVPGETARRCPDCGLTVFVPLSVAVLVAITRPGRAGRPDELLLVRHAYGPTGLWALVAGFVEAGESLEAAAHREVGEEVGLTIGRPRYVDSQPWAMSGPGTLLAGFTATVTEPDAEPVVDPRELTEARWFPVDALPAELPPAYSISRWLIDLVAAGTPR